MEGESGFDAGTVGSIDLRNGESAVDLTGQIQQLPCCIKYDGPCSVSHYFKPKSTGDEIDGLSMKEAHFRGRKLQGTTIPLPHSYSDGWENRWVVSDWKKEENMAGKWNFTSGKWSGNPNDKGIQTGEDYRFYAISAQFPEFSNKDKPLVFQFSVKHEQKLDRGDEKESAKRVFPLCESYLLINQFVESRSEFKSGLVNHAFAAGLRALLLVGF